MTTLATCPDAEVWSRSTQVASNSWQSVTRIVTKYRANFITSILTISGRSTKKSPYWVKQMVAKSSHKLSPKLVIIPSPKLSPIPADPQKNHPMGWNKKWQNCHLNFHQLRWSYHHLNYHQFWQIPPKITILGEKKGEQIITLTVTKYRQIPPKIILSIQTGH